MKLRSLLLFMIVIAGGSCANAQDVAQLSDRLTRAYEEIQSFRFRTADSLIRTVNTDHALYHLANANYLWWQIISGEDSPKNRSSYVQSSDKAISSIKDKEPSALNDEQLYTIITGYANKARIEGLNKSYLKGFVHINTCLKYIQRSFGREERFSYFNLTTGLYNYYMATANKNFPVLLPYLSLFPSGDLKKGKELLTAAANSNDKLLSTEGHYFLLKLYLEEKEYKLAEQHCSWLLVRYPQNILYTYYKFRIRLDQSKKDEALDVMSEIRLKEMMNSQLTALQKKHYSSLATKDLKEFYLKESNK